jgi:hypothetical protein
VRVDGALDAHAAELVAHRRLEAFELLTVAVRCAVVSEAIAKPADGAFPTCPARNALGFRLRAIGDGRRRLLLSTAAAGRKPTARAAAEAAAAAADRTIPGVPGIPGHPVVRRFLGRQEIERFAATPDPHENDEKAAK